MERKVTVGRTKNSGGYSNKSFKKPQWIKVMRMFFLVLLCALMLIVIIGKLNKYFKIFN